MEIGDRRPLIVQMVVQAYREEIGLKYFRCVPEPGSKTEENVVQFWKMATASGRPVREVVQKAVGLYSPDWCRQTFRRPYPPFNVVTSAKVLRRLERDLRPKERQNDEQNSQAAEEITQMLMSTVGLEDALNIVEGGWPEDKGVREVILSNLRNHKDTLRGTR